MGTRLKELRRARQRTQEALARQAGVGVDSLRKYEAAARTPLLDTAAKIAEALGVSVGVLAGTEPIPAAKAKKDRKGGEQ
jgi:transcriptional regulator with XRE-family HTH domain